MHVWKSKSIYNQKRPYNGRNRAEIRDAMLAKQVQIKDSEVPKGWSKTGADFINKLLMRKPQQRLGHNGPAEVKDHPWMKTVPWEKLYRKELPSPFLPPV